MVVLWDSSTTLQRKQNFHNIIEGEMQKLSVFFKILNLSHISLPATGFYMALLLTCVMYRFVPGTC